MKMIDPTYLRTIHEGLLSSTIHKDNMAALPVGLTGIYEEALSPESNLQERKKFLDFFAVWALLKKEVSISFVLPLLEGWTEEQVLEYIAIYSKWFNSPASGKYILYHERFKGFILSRQTNLKVRNNLLLKSLLKWDLNEVNSDTEVRNYLQTYFGDHLAISAYYKTKEEKAYNLLKSIDQFIRKRNWTVKDIDRVRWNEASAVLACMEMDIPFLKQIVLNQDQIINRKTDTDLLLNKVLENDLKEIDEILLFSKDDVKKHLFLLALIFRFLKILKTHNGQYTAIETSLNGLIQRLNTLKNDRFWIIPEEIIEKLNFELQLLAIEYEIDVELIDVSMYMSDGLGDIPYWNLNNQQSEFETRPLEYADLTVDLQDCSRLIKQNKNVFDDAIMNDLTELVDNTIHPEYKGEIDMLENIRKRIVDYRFEDDIKGESLYNIMLAIKESVSLTGSSDINYDYNDVVCKVIWSLHLRHPKITELSWIKCFCGSSDWIDTLFYFKVFTKTLSENKFQEKNIKSYNWSSKESFLTAGLSVTKILLFKGKQENAFKFYQFVINEFLNYELSNEIYFEYNKYLLKNEITDLEFQNLIKVFHENEFTHLPTISFCLCRKFNLLELINFMNYDNTLLSGVSENKSWINQILEGIISSLGIEDAMRYLLKGLDEYVSVMGGYQAYDYDNEGNRPKDNIWKIEWWVMGNVVSAYHLLADKYYKEKCLDYSSSDYGCELMFFDDENYYSMIEKIFHKYSFNPKNNLYIVIDDFKAEKAYKSRLTFSDILFEYRIKPLKALLKFNKVSQDKMQIKYLASAIRRDES